MRLVRARVTNFQCIDDSGWVDLAGVTCMVGKNESGKTAFLRALHRLNPLDEQQGRFDLVDYPKKGLGAYRRTHEQHPAVVVQAEFELSHAERREIDTAFGASVLTSGMVTATKNYANELTWQVGVSERAVVWSLVAAAELPVELARQARQVTNCRELAALLDGYPDKSHSIEALCEKALQHCTTDIASQVITHFVMKYAPRFVYFADCTVMRSRVSIQHMWCLAQQHPADLTIADHTFLALLSVSGVDLGELEDEHNDAHTYERLIAGLEAAAARITDEVFAFWTQHRQLRVVFDLSHAHWNDPLSPEPSTTLHLRIWDERHHVSVPFDKHSHGFTWFFSFLAYFAYLQQVVRERGTDLVLLLDEPGLSLHATAQQDLLRFIDERLAPSHQVLYTTHSPFMVDPQHIERLRTIQDVAGKGAVVSASMQHNDRDTLLPVQVALGYELGYELARTLCVGPHCLLVKGASDVLYLQVLSELAAAKGKRGLDPRWVLVPIGGVDLLRTVVALLGTDYSPVARRGESARNQWRIPPFLPSSALQDAGSPSESGQIIGVPDADLEDLFDPHFYLRLVNEAFADVLKKKLTLKALPEGSNHIMQRVEAYFQQEGVAGGHFSQLRVALYLLGHRHLLDQVDDATLARAALLFERVNRLLAGGTRAA
jgi:hypothetical protein